MNGSVWIVSYVLLWLTVVLLSFSVVALLRQVGVLHLRVAPMGVHFAGDSNVITERMNHFQRTTRVEQFEGNELTAVTRLVHAASRLSSPRTILLSLPELLPPSVKRWLRDTFIRTESSNRQATDGLAIDHLPPIQLPFSMLLASHLQPPVDRERQTLHAITGVNTPRMQRSRSR